MLDRVTCFHFLAESNEREARLLARNLSLHQVDFHVMGLLSNAGSNFSSYSEFPAGQISRLEVPPEIAEFFFAAKVFGAARAELLAEERGAEELLWLDADTLFIQSPALLKLEPGKKIAISPVHLTNISALAEAPLPPYWKMIFERCGVPAGRDLILQSIVDKQWLHAHFNAGLILTRPQNHLLRRWRQNLERLIHNPDFSPFFVHDIRYKIFFHQTILTATILAFFSPEEIQLLPPTYNFPLHLIEKIPSENRPASLNDLNSVRYDDFDAPNWPNALPVHGSLAPWLRENFAGVAKTEESPMN